MSNRVCVNCDEVLELNVQQEGLVPWEDWLDVHENPDDCIQSLSKRIAALESRLEDHRL